MATTSATLWPGMMCGRIARFENEAPRHFIRYGFALPSEIMDKMAAVGLYSVIAYTVSRQTHEIGIRMALGADARRIFKMVMTQGAWQLGIGLCLGAGAIATTLRAAVAGEVATSLPGVTFGVFALAVALSRRYWRSNGEASPL